MNKPAFYVIFGPPAVGKMTVGRALSERTGMPLFHNHMAIEPVLELFGFGTPAFNRLVDGFRHAVFEEVLASDLPGFIFTFVWAFDLQDETDAMLTLKRRVETAGWQVRFVELSAPVEILAERNSGADRLAAKPSKRDVAASLQRLRAHVAEHRFNTGGAFDLADEYLFVDNSRLDAGAAAELIVRHFT